MRCVFLLLNTRRIRTEVAPRVVGAIAPRIKLLPIVPNTFPRFTRAPFGFAALSSATGIALPSYWGLFRREQYSRRRNSSHRYMSPDVVQHMNLLSATPLRRPSGRPPASYHASLVVRHIVSAGSVSAWPCARGVAARRRRHGEMLPTAQTRESPRGHQEARHEDHRGTCHEKEWREEDPPPR